MEEEPRGLTWAVFSQQRRLFSELGWGPVSVHLPFLLPSSRGSMVLYFSHSAGMLPSALNWLLPSTHSFRTECLLLLLVTPRACKFMNCEWVTHPNGHSSVMKWSVPIISHTVSPLLESFGLLIEYLK